jgi:predicted Zn finger-like uncharacterized protein
MAIQCPRCGAQYDVTLFQFGRTVRCRCGRILDARKPHSANETPPPDLRIVERPADETERDREKP